jgi:Flp pilus assembly protein TadG
MITKQKGVALVEFALILPFLLLLSITAAELGRAIWEYNTLTKSVRDAARYLSIQTPGTKVTEARNLMVYGTPSFTGSPPPPLAIGLSLANVPVPSPGVTGCCSWQTAGSAPVINTVTVRITGYQFRPIFASVFGVGFPTVTYSPISATMRSYL